MGISATASIVTYNSSDTIRGVLESVSKSETSFPFHATVVDNASSDDTLNIVKEYPEIEIIEAPGNIGYGAGNNLCINRVDSTYHFIINPDISFESDFIQQAVDYMEAHPQVVMFNPDIRTMDGKRKYPPKALPAIHYIIPRVLHWNNKLFNKWRDEYTYKSKFQENPFEVGVCAGSLLVCRTDALKAVGGFDERYFLYYEDFDLSRMMAQQGKIECNPNVTVRHKGAKAAHHSKTARKYMIDSLVKYYKKWGWRL